MNRVIALFALLSALALDSHAAHPRVSVTYSPLRDAACAILRGGTIKEEWKKELVSRKAEFDSRWATAAPKLFEVTESITGKSFPGENVTAWLTLCNVPSQSFLGVSVNMRFALNSFTPSPVPMRYKVNTLFHELLHLFLLKHPVSDSALLARQSAESDCTRSHLHLLALQKAVLLNLQETEALREVVTIDGQLPGGCYKRAWAIVNSNDTMYLQYVAELAR